MTRVNLKTLRLTDRRWIVNELWTALRLKEWVIHTRDLRAAPPSSEGGVKGASGTPSTQPTSEVSYGSLVGITLPDANLGIENGYVFRLTLDDWHDARSRLKWGFLLHYLDELMNRTGKYGIKGIWGRQRFPTGQVVLRRNHMVSPEAAEALDEVLAFCEVMIAPDDVVKRMQRHPDAA